MKPLSARNYVIGEVEDAIALCDDISFALLNVRLSMARLERDSVEHDLIVAYINEASAAQSKQLECLRGLSGNILRGRLNGMDETGWRSFVVRRPNA
jgi:hypothetical protein